MRRANSVRRAAVVAILLTAALGLSACESTDPIPVPTKSEVIGTWTHGSSSLQLDADGSFILAAIPTGVVKQSPVANGTDPQGPDVDIKGAWHIGSGGNDAGGAPAVQLDFQAPQKVAAFTGLTLLVEGYTASDRQLYVNLGNPDSDIQFAYKKQN
jgi:hypothetical protein